LLTAHVYIINRVRFFSFADAAKYAVESGWIIVSWYLDCGNEIILKVKPGLVVFNLLKDKM